MDYLNSFWNWWVIAISVGTILACWWLLHWTKGVSDRSDDDDGSTGHVWDEDIRELNTPLPRWWLHLFNITIVFALVYLALFPGLGNFAGIKSWTQVGQFNEEVARATAIQESVFARFRDMDGAALMADQEAREIGGRLFGNNCAMCHGSDGRGAKSFPNLTDDDWLYGGDPDTILTTLHQGRNGNMPAKGTMPGMTSEQVDQVVNYVLSFSDRAKDEEAAAKGEQVFAQACVACHGQDGKGNQAMGAPNLTDNTWLYGSTYEWIKETVVNGRANQMPAQGDRLSDDQIQILAAYVYSLSN